MTKPSNTAAREADTRAAADAIAQFTRFMPSWTHADFAVAVALIAQTAYENGHMDGMAAAREADAERK